ncbi:hypothetical protein DSO57_1005930 [Entomophthora muscae]|uniref:Uncharacterized protein n=1 Tax=Entomophthora muscae TaxID=34485 RepID=A0ACC2RYW6_9FUNG|nr:hypothetical protein DSO57_1005930 [Entomophthora muscae]
MSLIQIFTLISVLSPALAVPAEECISQLFERCEKKHPDHGCAVFTREPKTPHPVHKYNWIEEKDQCTRPLGSPYFIVAIPKKQTAAWIERSGDGGFENWRYDPYSFNRINDKRISINNQDNEE